MGEKPVSIASFGSGALLPHQASGAVQICAMRRSARLQGADACGRGVRGRVHAITITICVLADQPSYSCLAAGSPMALVSPVRLAAGSVRAGSHAAAQARHRLTGPPWHGLVRSRVGTTPTRRSALPRRLASGRADSTSPRCSCPPALLPSHRNRRTCLTVC